MNHMVHLRNMDKKKTENWEEKKKTRKRIQKKYVNMISIFKNGVFDYFILLSI